MKLTKIAARNFKGMNFELNLDAGLILVGANFAGKSARTDAIRLLLLGYLPEQGKTARATFNLSSGREMTVTGTLEDGREIFRRWTLKGDSVKTETEGLEFLDLDEEAGEQLVTMLDAASYFDKSPNERVDYVFANLSRGPVKIPAAPELVAEIRGKLKEQDGTIVESLLLQVDGKISGITRKTPQLYLEQFLALTVESTKATRAEAARMEKTIQGLSQLRNAEAPGKSVAEYDDEIGKLTRSHFDLNERLNALRVEAAPIDRSRQRRAEIAQELDAGASVAAEIAQAKKDVALAEEAIEALRKERAQVDGDDRDPVKVQDSLSHWQTEVALIRSEHLNAERDKMTDEQALQDINTATVCPYCGACGDSWKDKRRAELKESIRKTDQRLATVAERLSLANKEAEAGRAILYRLRTLEAKAATLAGLRNGAEAKVQKLETSAGRLASLREELDRLPGEDPRIAQKASEVEKTAVEVLSALRQVQEKRSAARARELELARLADAEKARDLATAAFKVADAAVDAVREVKAALVEKVFAPLLAEANALFPGILRTPIAYHEGEIGTWRGGAWVKHSTFSGTEKALVYGAIQFALAARSPFRFLILDELGRLDDRNARKVNEAVARALENGVLEQFVGIDAGRAELHQETKAFRVQEVTS